MAQGTDSSSTGQLEALRSLRKELDVSKRARLKAYRAAETTSAQNQALGINPWADFRERAETLAFEAEGTEVAAGAWALVFSNEREFGSRDSAWMAFDILINDHADSSELEPVVAEARYVRVNREKAVSRLRQLLETSSLKSLQASSLFSMAKILEPNPEQREEALGYYKRIVSDYPDVSSPRGATFAAMSSGALFEAKHLQVGLPVPDIASVDETNTAFRLSDYKGKVVLVDFWGFW